MLSRAWPRPSDPETKLRLEREGEVDRSGVHCPWRPKGTWWVRVPALPTGRAAQDELVALLSSSKSLLESSVL